MAYITFRDENGDALYYRGIDDDKGTLLTSVSKSKAKKILRGYYINAEMKFLERHFKEDKYPFIKTMRKEDDTW